jgi:chemotaxis protein CheX
MMMMMNAAGQSTNAIDAKLVNTLMQAVMEVCGTMAGTQVTLKEVVPSLDYKPTGDISSVIGISGEHGEGMLTLSFTEPMAGLLVGRLLGMAPEEICSEDMCDGIGELVNMVSGRAKTSLSEDSGSLYRLSLPSIIKGPGHEIGGRPKNCPFLFLVFEADGHSFVLQVTFRYF